jgi:hypothetical protein
MGHRLLKDKTQVENMILASVGFVVFTIIDLVIVALLLYIGCGTVPARLNRSLSSLLSSKPVKPSVVHQIVPTTAPPKRSPPIESGTPELAPLSDLDQTAKLIFNASSQFRHQIMSMQQDENAQKFAEALFENLNQALTQALQEIESEIAPAPANHPSSRSIHAKSPSSDSSTP